MSDEYYFCDCCDYFTYRKDTYQRHLKSKKHLTIEKEYPKNNTKTVSSKIIPPKFILDKFVKSKNCRYMCGCGKSYKHSSGLWKHAQKCNEVPNAELINQADSIEPIEPDNYQPDKLTEETVTMTKQEYYNNIKIAQLEQQVEVLQDVVSKNKTTSSISTNINRDQNNIQHNQNINVNMYLNEKCANAMSITDFIDKVKVSLSDLEYTTQQGYIEGVSSILIKHLHDLEPEERPIHCSNTNKKKQHFYIKNDHEWKTDDDNSETDKFIDKVSSKQACLIKKWCSEHPNWIETPAMCDEYHRIVQNVLSGSNTDKVDKNRKAIKKIIGNEIRLDDNIKC